ncbi:MAG: chemotaxis protein CheA [Cyclobacteriaceae bacterium]
MVNLRNIYLEEAEDLFKQMEQSLLMLENSPEDSALIADVFRSMHTLKGSSSMYGSTKVADFIHNIETIYDKVRAHEMTLSRHVIDTTFKSLDHLRKIVLDPEISDAADVQNHAELSDQIKNILESSSETSTEMSPEFQHRNKTYLVRFEPNDNLFLDGTNPLLLVDELADLGKARVYAYINQKAIGKDFHHDKCYTTWDVILATDAGENALKDVFIFVEDTSKISVDVITNGDLVSNSEFVSQLPKKDLTSEPFKIDTLKKIAEGLQKEESTPVEVKEEEIHVAAPSTKGPAVAKGKTISSIRVPSDKLDELMNQVSELVTTQAGLSLYSQNNPDPLLETISENVEKLSRQLRDIAFGMTLIEINNLFGRFQRFVRDVSIQLDKSVEFITEGGETELDKTIIESLTDPLMHLIRNSVDHGIETREERIKKGKPSNGSIKLKAYYSGAKVYIQIQDDGSGLDTEKIRKKAIEKGIITKEDNLTEKEIFDLIFTAGFSTATNVSDLSGRGVGMDVVKKNIMEIRGDISVSSEKDKGTTITLGLPLTLSVIDGLLVKLQETYFVIPLAVVNKCHEVLRTDLENDFNQLILLDGEQLPFVDLRREFHMEDDSMPAKSSVIIIHNGESKIGLCVDNIVGEYQAVLKPVGKYYRHQEFISGATILGDGTIALVLDTYKIISHKVVKQKLTAQ